MKTQMVVARFRSALALEVVLPQTITLTATASVAEGNSGTKSQTITATQSATSTTNTTVTLTTSGTASDNGTDYTLDNSTILISAGFNNRHNLCYNYW